LLVTRQIITVYYSSKILHRNVEKNDDKETTRINPRIQKTCQKTTSHKIEVIASV
jgi:hypothetical protein